MAYNIDFSTALKVSKPDNHSKTVDFPSGAAEKTNSFRDSLNEAVRNKSQNVKKNDGSSALRKELVNKSEAKLKSIKKPDVKKSEGTVSELEGNEKQVDIIAKTIEEMLSKLEELTNLQQPETLQTNGQTAVLNCIKEALGELTALQIKSTGAADTNLQAVITELTTVLEGMQNEVKTNGSVLNNEAIANFKQELKKTIVEVSSKPEAVNKPQANSNLGELTKGKEINNNEEAAIQQIPVSSKTDNELEAQKSENADNLKVEGKPANDETEKQNQGMKVEAAAAQSKPVNKDLKPASEEAVDEVKSALDSKVEKVTVESKEGKESKNQDTEERSYEEAAYKIPKAVNNMQNKPVTGEMTDIKLEQTVIEDQLEVVQKQTVVPKSEAVNKAEVINQIVKKAEMVITDANTEMRMQLEPENLGKLTLKLAVEKGLITAKFVAESYEVKQIIESSFNELKDMLQEKGMEVQNFSVTVGQENRENNSSNSFQQWKETVKLNGRSMNKGSYEGQQTIEGTVRGAVNPYSRHNGIFDYRA